MSGKWLRRGCGLFGAVFVAVFSVSCRQETATTVEQVMDDIQSTQDVDDYDIQMDDVILKVGEEEVSYREVLFYIYEAVNKYEASFDQGIWDVELKDGVTFNNYAKQEIIKELTELKIIGQQAKEEGVTMTEDEMVDVKKQAKTFLAGVSEQDKITYGFDEDLLVDIYEDHALANKMFEVTTGKASTQVSDEEARQYSVQYLKVSIVTTDTDGNEKEMTDKEKKAALKEAKKLYNTAKSTKDFLSFAKENSDDDTVSLTFGQDNKPEEFGDAAMKLKTGDLSQIVKGTTGYYIIYCVSDDDEDATSEKKEEIIKERQKKIFEDSYTEWSENYTEIVSTKLWEKISLKNF